MNKTSKEILSHFITVMKGTLEEMIKEERRAYLDENTQTKANGYYTRDLNTPIGAIKDLRVAGTRDGGFSRELNERYMSRELKGFETAVERYYENKHASALNVGVYEETQFI